MRLSRNPGCREVHWETQSSHSAFPHENTSDEFYSEDQFESYRVLGDEIATKTFKPISDLATEADILQHIWVPRLRQAAIFTQHSGRLIDLWGNLRNTPSLNVLDPQLTPHWPAVPPVGYRDGFYTGSQMLQLMENVYLDLRLDESWDHADNAGWRATFLTWGQSAIVKDAWQLSKKTYGKRFGHFCQRELKLK